jgi:hypothetical protein
MSKHISEHKENLFVQETFINRTENYHLDESNVYESFSNDSGQLFKLFRKEYGRCISRIYVDQLDVKPISIGWVFLKRMKYSDTNKYYLQETWITLHQKPPTKTIEYHYVDIDMAA